MAVLRIHSDQIWFYAATVEKPIGIVAVACLGLQAGRFGVRSVDRALQVTGVD